MPEIARNHSVIMLRSICNPSILRLVSKVPLTEADYARAARALAVDVPAIKAVAEVESAGDGFLDTDEPTILFERHKFHKHTGGRFSQAHPDISNPKSGGYGKTKDQHARLQKAVALDRDAALMSTSWGKFQVLGENWEDLEYADLQEFINTMYRTEADHLDSFVRYVKANNLDGALRAHRWAAFAKGYNGKNYKAGKYHTKLARAYAKHNKTP